MIKFSDISYAQGAYNMAANTDQIIAMKASGFYTSAKTPYLDAQLSHNYSNAVQAGKVPILYHFAGGADPTAEANYFIEAVQPYAAGDVYALDWEIDVPNPVEWVNTFVTHVHAVTGVWPLVYMDISRLNASDWSPVLNNCGLWCAAPSFSFEAQLPVKYTVVAQQGPIVNGVDSDMWFGTIEQLKEYGYHAPQTSSPPSPTPVAVPAAPEAPAPVPVEPTAPAPLPEPAPAPLPPAPEPTPTPAPEAPPTPSPAPATVVTGPAVPPQSKKVLLALIAAVSAAVIALLAWLHS